MKVTQNLAVTKEEFHNFICNMVEQDILEATHIAPAISEIESEFEYEKSIPNRMGKAEKVFVKIDSLNNHNYTASFTSSQGKNTLSYEYLPSELGNTIDVVYEEGYYGITTSAELSYKILSFVTKRTNKKRMNQLLQTIEKMIIEKR